MKTVFITSFHPHISRNIFSTDVLAMLKAENNLRIVIICPNYKVDYFQKNFASPSEASAKEGRVIVEGVSMYQSSKTRTGLFFKRLALYMLPSETRRIKQRHKLYEDKNYLHFGFFVLVNFLGRSFLIRRFARYADLKLSPAHYFGALFDKYKPDAIFATDIQDENDTAIMQAAKKRAIPILGMFRSWDNPTQGILRVFPDKLLAGSTAVFDETVFWQGYPQEKISIVGHPHYDKYLKGPTKTREEFFREFGLDSKKKLILFTPLGDKFVRVNDMDYYGMEVVGAADAQMWVRFPPDEPVTLKNFTKPANMVFHRPGFAFSGKFEDREIRKEDDDSLINEIYWSDLVLAGPTSINLDAAFFDKPVAASHLVPPAGSGPPRNYFDDVYCFDFSHVRKVLGTGGTRYIRNKQELDKAIEQYFKNPKLDAAGRAEIRSLWFSHADGKSSERVAKEIIFFTDSTR